MERIPLPSVISGIPLTGLPPTLFLLFINDLTDIT